MNVFSLVEPEILAEVDTAHVFIRHHVIRSARHQHLPIVQNVSAVHDFERFAHIVVRNQDADATFFQIGDQIFYSIQF